MKPQPVWRILSNARAQTGRAARGLWIIWAAYSALALLAAAPAAASLAKHFGFSVGTGKLALELDPAAIAEWIYATRSEPALHLAAAILAGVAAAVALAVFLAGGALAQLAKRAGFLEGGGRYFWRFLRLALLAGLFYLMVFGLAGTAHRGVRWLFEDSMAERPYALASQAVNVLLLLLIWTIAAAFDYAKVRMVVDDSRHAIAAGFAALFFVLRNPWKTLAPLAFIAVCGAVLFAFYQTSYNLFDYRGLRTILISIAGQQIYILLRVWLRLWQWSTCFQVDLALRRPSSPWALTEPEPHGDNI